jgi:transcriptional regulator with XRE-family HTH domain
VFEIGENLRQARERQGLELADVEDATRIGSPYLAALEQERFERLPAPAYARAFLRGYAGFLGLDATPFLDEFDARFGEPEPPPPPPPRRLPRLPTRAGVWVAILGAAAVAVVLTILAFGFPGGQRRATSQRPPATSPSRPPAPARAVTHPHSRPPARKAPTLVLTAARGDCWLSVHAGSPSGPLLYEGILPSGRSLWFARNILWIRMGDPSSLTARLDGVPVTNLPAQTGNVLVTRTGIHPQ